MFTKIIFDIGGILIPEKSKIINNSVSNELGISESKYNEYLGKYEESLTKGFQTYIEFFQKIIDKEGIKKDPEKILEFRIKLFKKHMTKRDPQIIELIYKLKQNYDVVGLTNTEPESGDFCIKDGMYNYFNPIIISCKVNMMKPEEDIFLLAAGDTPPKICIYIDDNPKYVKGAEKVGIKSILYVGYEQLIKDLKKFNVKID